LPLLLQIPCLVYLPVILLFMRVLDVVRWTPSLAGALRLLRAGVGRAAAVVATAAYCNVTFPSSGGTNGSTTSLSTRGSFCSVNMVRAGRRYAITATAARGGGWFDAVVLLLLRHRRGAARATLVSPANALCGLRVFSLRFSVALFVYCRA
jgi:hypothetical protein